MIDIIKDGDVDQFEDFDNRYLRRDGGFAVERNVLKNLPIIDISPFVANGSTAAREQVARQLRKACVDVGFFYLTGHGFAPDELDELIDWGHRFFELPEPVKMELHSAAPGQPGYMRIGGINPEANPDKAADLKERFVISRELLPGEPTEGWRAAGLSRWPNDGVLPGFTSFMQAQIVKRVALAQKLARALAMSLDLPEGYFDDVHRYLGVVSIINYYPPFDQARANRTQWSFSPHTDYGGFTLLTQDSLGGLQVRNAAGDWIDVPPITGTFVVNIGDLFATWTNDLYTSNLHRALNVSDKARISFPFFASPQGATRIECLPTCQSPDNPPRYAPVTAGEYVRTLIEQSDRTGRPGISKKTADRFRKTG
jgi:isopenicillin N synthase-like dioxygenase